MYMEKRKMCMYSRKEIDEHISRKQMSVYVCVLRKEKEV